MEAIRKINNDMMMDPTYVSPKDYLKMERASEERHEYYEGEVITMHGALRSHERIVSNLVREVGVFLKDQPCEVFGSNMRAATPSSNAYMYPDVSIYCEEVKVEDDHDDTLSNPMVIFEVLSPSTEGRDRGRKFYFYRQIPSLKEYILIDINRYLIDIYRRRDDDSWKFEAVTDPSGYLGLHAINYRIPMKEIYRRVKFLDKVNIKKG